MPDLPTNLRVTVHKDQSKTYRYDPPNDAVKNGIVRRRSFGRKKDTAIRYAIKQNALIEKWRAGEIAGNHPTSKFTYWQLLQSYMQSERYRRLATVSQKSYRNLMTAVLSTQAGSRELGKLRVQELQIKHCTMAYEQWLKSGVTSAMDKLRMLSILVNYANSLEIMFHNPVKYVQTIAPKPRRVKWTQDYLRKFFEYAFSKFEYRNIGLIVYMAYEWCQRAGDIRNLKWDAIDFETNTVTITQSKRGETVYLPMSNGLMQMLMQQKKELGFQPYVVPNLRPSDGAYRPYSIESISRLVNEVKQAAGLPEELQAWDLRRTGITELVEAGVDMFQIMQVSGHSNPASVKPYLVNTRRGAANALLKRFGEDTYAS